MGSSLRLVSANLANGAACPEAFAELVRRYAPDVVATQELGPDQADALARVLPHGELTPSRDHTGMGIALRHPGRLTRLAPIARNACMAQLEIADWPHLGRPLEVVNVHIAAPHRWPPWAQARRRHRQVDGLLAHLAAHPDRARAVVGDFNATPLWPVYRRVVARIEDLVLTHARAVGTRPGRTWPRWRGAPLIRIDHAFGSGLAVEGVEVVDLPGSDHFALVVDVSPA